MSARHLIAPLSFAALLIAQVSVAVAADRDQQCVHWTSAFVFTEFMDRAKVNGDKGQRLYFHKPHPILCASTTDCRRKGYVISGDEVTIGNVCQQWAFVEFRVGRSATTGWVELNRLANQAPDSKTLSTRRKWSSEISRAEPLVAAAFAGDIVQVQRLISADHPARTKALFAAAHANREDVVDLLLKSGVSPNDDSEACSLLATASVDSNRGILQKLLKAGADVNCRVARGQWTPLMWVAFQNRAMTSVLVAIGRVTNPHPDHLAAVQFLIDAGANIDAKDSWGSTALRRAFGSNNVDIATLLLSRGADANNYIDDSTSISVQSGNTTLMEAIFWYSLRLDHSMIAVLLAHGANANYRNELRYDEECDKTTSGKCTFQGQTALTRAAADGHLNVVRLLLENKADPSLPRTDGKTPAQIARANGHFQTAALIERYARNSMAPASTPLGQ
jgi:ankyrin repeat protein